MINIHAIANVHPSELHFVLLCVLCGLCVEKPAFNAEFAIGGSKTGKTTGFWAAGNFEVLRREAVKDNSQMRSFWLPEFHDPCAVKPH